MTIIKVIQLNAPVSSQLKKLGLKGGECFTATVNSKFKHAIIEVSFQGYGIETTIAQNEYQSVNHGILQ